MIPLPSASLPSAISRGRGPTPRMVKSLCGQTATSPTVITRLDFNRVSIARSTSRRSKRAKRVSRGNAQ